MSVIFLKTRNKCLSCQWVACLEILRLGTPFYASSRTLLPKETPKVSAPVILLFAFDLQLSRQPEFRNGRNTSAGCVLGINQRRHAEHLICLPEEPTRRMSCAVRI